MLKHTLLFFKGASFFVLFLRLSVCLSVASVMCVHVLFCSVLISKCVAVHMQHFEIDVVPRILKTQKPWVLRRCSRYQKRGESDKTDKA